MKLLGNEGKQRWEMHLKKSFWFALLLGLPEVLNNAKEEPVVPGTIF